MGKTVLLVMDIQHGVLERVANADSYLERLVPAIRGARDAKMPIIYITTAFREGYPESSPRNTSTGKVAEWGAFQEGDKSTTIHPAVAPVKGDVTVTKRRVSAFFGTDLDIILRTMDAETLVLTGLSTSGVVLSTLRQAADMDYRISVIEDLCMDTDDATHHALMKVFAKQARVIASSEWISTLTG